jgi:hypothetical protein
MKKLVCLLLIVFCLAPTLAISQGLSAAEKQRIIEEERFRKQIRDGDPMVQVRCMSSCMNLFCGVPCSSLPEDAEKAKIREICRDRCK